MKLIQTICVLELAGTMYLFHLDLAETRHCWCTLHFVLPACLLVLQTELKPPICSSQNNTVHTVQLDGGQSSNRYIFYPTGVSCEV